MLTKKQDNRYKAYDNLHQALTLDTTPYQKDKALQDIVARLGLNLTGIKTKQVPGTRATKGITEDKSTARALVNTLGAELAGDLFSYATKIQNATLQAEADYNLSALEAMGGTRVTTVLGLIRQRLTDHATALEDYAVDADRLKEFDDAFALYDGQRNNPRQQQSQNAAGRLTTGGYFRALGALVKDEFRRSMRKYQRLAPEFYERVMKALEVIDQPATRQPPLPPTA